MNFQKGLDRRHHFSIRKLSIGVTSVMIATVFYLETGSVVRADQITTDIASTTVAEQNNQIGTTTNNEVANNEINTVSKKVTAEEAKDNSDQRIEEVSILPSKKPEMTNNDGSLKIGTETVKLDTQIRPNNKLLRPNNKLQTMPAPTVNDFIDVSDADTFTQTLTNAKKDGSETKIRLVNDIDLGNTKVDILTGQNIHISNDHEKRTIYLGDQWFVHKGANLVLEGSFDEATGEVGLAITRPQRENPQTDETALNKPDEKGWITWLNEKSPEAAIVINGQAKFNNVDVHDLFTAGGGKMFAYEPGGTVLVTGKDSSLDLEGHTQIRDNVMFGTMYSFLQEYNYAAGITYYVDPTENYKVTGNIGPDVVFKNNSVQFGNIRDVYGKPNKSDPGVPMAAGALAISRGGEVNITGTTFENNIGGYYGAIMIGGRYNIMTASYAQDVKAHVNIHGAKIINNTGAISGGGITIDSGADVVIDGDTLIANNKVGFIGDKKLDNSFTSIGGTRSGGGLSIGEDPLDAQEYGVGKTDLTHVVIDGATIDGNLSTDVGGGIYINTDGVELKKAIISNNTAYSQGGGIYVSSVPYNLRMSNAAIYKNTAKTMLHAPIKSSFVMGSGGGIWACPTGSTVINVTNGWAVFDNTAENLGDDFYHEELDPKIKAELNVQKRSLGGGDANWTHDRDIMDGQQLGGSEELVDAGLKSHLLDTAKTLAKKLATVHIFGNSATYGGGIGTNGGVYSNFNPNDERTRQIEIKKVWADQNKATPGAVVIDVFATIDDEKFKITNFRLTKENNWSYTLTDLPIGIKYSFVEQAIDLDHDGQADWIQDEDSVEEKEADADKSKLIITNRWNNTKPPKPDEPIDPEKPTNPDNPIPETPSTPEKPTPEVPNTPEKETQTPDNEDQEIDKKDVKNSSYSKENTTKVAKKATKVSNLPNTGENQNNNAELRVFGLISLVFASLLGFAIDRNKALK